MSELEEITPLILTYNEEDNIARALQKLTWARSILVIDSGSTDATLSILAGYPQVRVVFRAFDTFADQCNFGLAQVRTPWVLSLDADYLLPDAFIAELRNLNFADDCPSYSARFQYVVYGKALRATLYPRRTVLYKRAHAHYHNEGHGHRVNISGATKPLSAPIHHDDRKPLARWFGSQQGYARKEAEFLLSQTSVLKLQDKLRLWLWPAPILVFFYTLLVKGCLFDGWRGWFYVLQRLVAECMLALELLDRRLTPGSRR